MSAIVSAIGKSQPGPSHRCKSEREDCNGQHNHRSSDTNDTHNDRAKNTTKSSSESTNEKMTTSSREVPNKMNSSPTERPAAIRKSNTTTVSKFKEKRPEPLKLNPNLNQDIPLDLSVKSAGNVPSGTLSNIFNLGPTNHLTTLETPRIQWQDNDALLVTGKARLFSSSTNASQRARISSLIGDSPPVTPNTPLVLESPSTFESRKAQILDRWAQTSKPQINHLRNEFMNGHRRSCSSDNLNISTPHDKSRLIPEDAIRGVANGFSNVSKKNAISPLAIKSLSTTQNNTATQNKFSYTNQQIASNLNESRKSPNGNSNSNGKSLTPTSVSNATANLLNIHLNSPTGLSQSPIASTPCKSPSFSSFEQEYSILDPLMTAPFGQQHSSRNSSINFSSPSLSGDLNNNNHRNGAAQYQQQNLASISSSTTLNTPTLNLSPSQLKAGHLCFLQSPTLSPMSSVFDLPSPFLMFPPSAQNQQQGKQYSPKMAGSQANDQPGSGSEMQVDIQDGPISNVSKSCDTLQAGATSSAEAKSKPSSEISSNKDLSHLITSASRKIIASGQKVDTDGDITMDCDLADEVSAPTVYDGAHGQRPATTIPQICVSDHQLEVADRGSTKPNNGIDQEGAKRAFCVQVSNYRNERSESSSAPPDVYQRRARSKIKTIAADSCINITDKFQNDTSSYQQNKAGRPYPEIREWFPSASHLLHTQACTNGSDSPLGARSNSAEPAVFPGLALRKTGIYSSSVINSNNTKVDCCQSATQCNNGSMLSNSAQQLHYNSSNDASRSKDIGSLNQTTGAGLNCSNINTINPNQQLLQQYSPSHTYLQQQSHQHSSSAGELSRLTEGNSDLRPAIIPSNNHMVGYFQSVRRFQQPETSQLDFMRQHQQSNQQGISSSLNRVDYLLGEHHQIREDQRRHMHENFTSVDQAPMMRQLNNQSSVINLLCNNETCQRQMPYTNSLQTGSTTKPSTTTTQHQQRQSLMAAETLSTSHNRMSSNNINGSYQIDIETRSDSRSSSSLDFSCQFLDGGSRANSEASSNMTSKKYHCDQCSKSFTRSDMLTRHKRLHSGDRPFQCTECKQEFSRSDHLSTHMRTHTGEKPYKCKLCSYSACRKDMITRHLKVHSRNPNSNDFV